LPAECIFLSTQLALTESSLPEYLRRIGLFEPSDRIRVERAGDGNINWVRRAFSPGGKSFIVKQARPALERFPEYQVSTERLVFEARYFELARAFDEARTCPGIHAFLERDRVLVLEDLGAAERLDRALLRGAPGRDAAATLGAFLGRVHAGTRGADLVERFRNQEMQRLHGDHIFRLPLEANDFPLPPRIRERADLLGGDERLRAVAAECYSRYLRPEGALVHGDVQAGNVLLTGRGPVLLDAEIAHVGDPAFDVGTLVAHLALPAVAKGAAAEALASISSAWRAYAEAHGPGALAGFPSVTRYAGLELLRRTIGAARLEAVASDDAGLRVIDTAVDWILSPREHAEALA